MQRRPRGGAILYWTGAVVLTVFGFLAIFSIGAPFFLTGVAMLAVGRWRSNPAVVWPALVGVWLLVIAYVLVGPGSCTGTARAVISGSPPSVGRVTCTNPLGIDYAGTGNYSPSLLPGFLAGLAAGIIGALLTRRLLDRRPNARPETPIAHENR